MKDIQNRLIYQSEIVTLPGAVKAVVIEFDQSPSDAALRCIQNSIGKRYSAVRIPANGKCLVLITKI